MLILRNKTYHTNFSFKGKRIRKTTGTSDKKIAMEYATRLKEQLWQQAFLGKVPVPVKPHRAAKRLKLNRAVKGLTLRNKIYHTNIMFKGKRIRKSTGTSDRKLAEEYLTRLKAQLQKSEMYKSEMYWDEYRELEKWKKNIEERIVALEEAVHWTLDCRLARLEKNNVIQLTPNK